MEIDITIKNYRCFPDTRPAHITIRPGFTAFVGVNNSGKSSLLKFFYEFRSLFQAFSPNSSLFLQAVRGGLGVFTIAHPDILEIFCDSNDRPLEIAVRVAGAISRPQPTPEEIIITIPRATNQFSVQIPNLQGDLTNLTVSTNNLVYHPGSRALVDVSDYFAAFQGLSQCLYVGPFRNAINVGSNASYFDIQVGQSFIQTWRNWKTGPSKRDNEAAYNLTRDIKHILDFEELEINPSPDDATLKVFINSKSYELSAVGSGLTQFILVLANATVRRPSYVLIDEPELNLHPSLQLDFLTTLASYSRHGVLFGTHSVGLARASADWIYGLRRIAHGDCDVTPFEGMRSLSEFLGELSFSVYRELGFDKILLVEGVTEVKTVQQLLRLYKKDHITVLLPLGGSQMINTEREAEIQEIKRISPNVFAIVDSERTAADDPLDTARQGFVDVCRKVGITCHVFERRALENYFSDAAVKRVKGDSYRQLGAYEKLSEVRPAWSKAENWRIAREMTLQDLQNTDLGEFLSSL